MLSKDSCLALAIVTKLSLSIIQLIAFFFSASLALFADAMHNLTDVASLLVALFAKRVSQKAPDQHNTFGYERAEVLGVLINSGMLLVLGCYLLFEGVIQCFAPDKFIDGWLVLWITLFTLVVNTACAFLTYWAGAKDSLNIRAVFIHNAADAIATLGVLLSACIIILFEFHHIDALVTLAIAVYILYQGYFLFKRASRIIMQSVPEDLCLETITTAIAKVEGVLSVESLRVWQLNEKKVYCEAVIRGEQGATKALQGQIKSKLKKQFGITQALVEAI